MCTIVKKCLKYAIIYTFFFFDFRFLCNTIYIGSSSYIGIAYIRNQVPSCKDILQVLQLCVLGTGKRQL